MTKRGYRNLLILSGVSMCVLVAIQYQWFTNAHQLKTVEFDERVNAVLSNTVSFLDRKEASQKVKSYFARTSSIIANRGTKSDVLQFRRTTALPFRFPRENIRRNDSNERVRLSTRLNYSSLRTDRAYRDSIINSGLVSNIVWQVITEIDTSKATTQQRLQGANLDSILQSGFNKAGLNVTYTYKIHSKLRDSLLQVKNVTGNEAKSDNKTYSAKLFPSFPFPENDYLALSVVNRERIILQSMLQFFIVSLLVFLLILGTLGISVITVLRQKKLAQVQKDFVNNVTHELKTPIASINLAAETILNDKVVGDKEKVGYFAIKILKENHRMDQKIDRILLSAVAENGNFAPRQRPTDFHDVITAAVEEIKAKLDQYRATLKMDLSAKNSLVSIDEQHFQNALVNLLDNAVKYAKDVPEIEIVTSNNDHFLYLVMTDRGIGISRNDQQQIFKKFFRSSTGDTQEAKGFGIGLHYVYQVVKAHRGSIHVESTLGKGSSFTLKLPLY